MLHLIGNPNNIPMINEDRVIEEMNRNNPPSRKNYLLPDGEVRQVEPSYNLTNKKIKEIIKQVLYNPQVSLPPVTYRIKDNSAEYESEYVDILDVKSYLKRLEQQLLFRLIDEPLPKNTHIRKVYHCRGCHLTVQDGHRCKLPSRACSENC